MHALPLLLLLPPLHCRTVVVVAAVMPPLSHLKMLHCMHCRCCCCCHASIVALEDAALNALQFLGCSRSLHRQPQSAPNMAAHPLIPQPPTPPFHSLIPLLSSGAQINFYSVQQRKIVKRLTLSDWALSMSLSPSGHLIAVGTQQRLLKLIDFAQGTFQDYAAHSDSVRHVCFGGNGRRLFSAGYDDIAIWDVLL